MAVDRPAEDVLGDVLNALGQLHGKFGGHEPAALRREMERILSDCGRASSISNGVWPNG